MNNLKMLPNFIHRCMTIGEIPTSYKMSLTYEEQLMWFCRFLEEQVIPVVNNNSEVVQELKTFIENYFENLDIQDEVNQKLEEMAESGQLDDIIAQYLQLKGVLAFNTLNELKNATNIVNGSICCIIGQNSYNDGKTAFYKIRTMTSSDVVDDFNIISLNVSNTLIGERLPNYYIKLLNQEFNNLNNKFNLLDNKKYLFIGDSYATGYQGSNVDNIEGYFDKVINQLNLNGQIIASNGYGFKGLNGNLKWLDLIQATTIENKNSFTDIIICGGMNDKDYVTSIDTDAINLFNYLKNNFPNAKIHLGSVGRFKQNGTETELIKIREITRKYKKLATTNGIKFIDNSNLILHNINWFIDDNVHPNTSGQIQLAYAIEQYILNGEINDLMEFGINSDFEADNITPTLSNIDLSYFQIYSYINKNNVGCLIAGEMSFSPILQVFESTDFIIGKLSKSYLTASAYSQGLFLTTVAEITVNGSVNGSNKIKMHVRLYNDKENNLHLKFINKMDNGNQLIQLEVTKIEFYGIARQIIDGCFC